MRVIVPIEHIVIDELGTVRVKRAGITVAFLSTLINDPEWPMERILENYEITPAEVYAAWSYYYDHKEEIERWMKEGMELAERIGVSGEELRKRWQEKMQQK